jgi:hypothetical protein
VTFNWVGFVSAETSAEETKDSQSKEQIPEKPEGTKKTDSYKTDIKNITTLQAQADEPKSDSYKSDKKNIGTLKETVEKNDTESSEQRTREES